MRHIHCTNLCRASKCAVGLICIVGVVLFPGMQHMNVIRRALVLFFSVFACGVRLVNLARRYADREKRASIRLAVRCKHSQTEWNNRANTQHHVIEIQKMQCKQDKTALHVHRSQDALLSHTVATSKRKRYIFVSRFTFHIALSRHRMASSQIITLLSAWSGTPFLSLFSLFIRCCCATYALIPIDERHVGQKKWLQQKLYSIPLWNQG